MRALAGLGGFGTPHNISLAAVDLKLLSCVLWPRTSVTAELSRHLRRAHTLDRRRLLRTPFPNVAIPKVEHEPLQIAIYERWERLANTAGLNYTR